jgi:hypothetical protein
MTLSVLAVALVPLLIGALLIGSGTAKLFGRNLRRQATDSALVVILGDVRRAIAALRTVGGIELCVGVALIALPTWGFSAAATVLLGLGFVGYLGYARVRAPGSSCGCTANEAGPIGWRSFVRAGVVGLGGLVGFLGTEPWWHTLAGPPGLAAAILLAALSIGLYPLWWLPFRRLRLRLLGHPLASTAGGAGDVPVVATVELLERSLAWQTAAPIVRSGLVEHWDVDGWRVLRYTGVYESRPVSVLFAIDATATVPTTPEPAIRVSVVDNETAEPLPLPATALP